MNVKILLILFALAQFEICANEREKIVTIISSGDENFVTTGNGNVDGINFENMHLKEEFEDKKEQETLSKLKAEVQKYIIIKNSLIIDFPSEDPKKFMPDDPSYFKVASKRGFLFTSLAVFMLLFLFSVFYLRIASGECGGYKTIIRKPTKSMRYSIFARVSIGTLIFIAGFGIVSYFSYKDRNISLKIAKDLMHTNHMQVNRIEDVAKAIKRINKKKFNVIYSVLSYERFQIGFFVQNLKKVYEKSLEQAEELNRTLFIGTKNQFFIKLVVILIGLLTILVAWFFVYKNRGLTFALVLAFGAGLLVIYMIHVLGSSFNSFSIFTEVCYESIESFNEDKGELRVRFYNSFQNILTCLPQKETELMTAQMNSLLIAENTLLIVLRNFFRSIDKKVIDSCNGLEKATDIIENFDYLKNEILEYTKVEEKTDTLLRQNILDVLNSARDIPTIYQMASELHSCQQLKNWNRRINEDMCSDGLSAQFYSLIAFFVAILGVVVVCMGIFSSENIIRGLFNEEIQYVKTNKLRYDWN